MIAEILVKSSKSMMRSMFCFDRALVCLSVDHPRDQNELSSIPKTFGNGSAPGMSHASLTLSRHKT